jgi:hypothetical protein
MSSTSARLAADRRLSGRARAKHNSRPSVRSYHLFMSDRRRTPNLMDALGPQGHRADCDCPCADETVEAEPVDMEQRLAAYPTNDLPY